MALQSIRAARSPKSEKAEYPDLDFKKIQSQSIFSFDDPLLHKYKNMLELARNYTIQAIAYIIYWVSRYYENDLTQVVIEFESENVQDPLFTFLDEKNKTFIFFKDINEGLFWQAKSTEQVDVQKTLDKYHVSKCLHIYLVYDKAYLLVIGHNDDESDPGRGYNHYSLLWFFEQYFGKEEAEHFKKCLIKYSKDVEACLGYMITRSLTPSSLISFRRITENKVKSFNYSFILHKEIDNSYLISSEYDKLMDQFLMQKTFLCLLGSHDFSESLITAEWLYSSMKKAQAIDLTVIGMGYIKCVEQLLCEIICLHKNENRHISAERPYHSQKPIIELNKRNIDSGIIDFSLGSMAHFVKDNTDILRSDLNLDTIYYIKESIFQYKNKRNGYFHKDNIADWAIIDSIRKETYYLFFLLLGGMKIGATEMNELGVKNNNGRSDYQMLCEYTNYHRNELFFLVDSERKGRMMISCPDDNTSLNDDGSIEYSGVYLKPVGENKDAAIIKEENLPAEIYLGELTIARTEFVDVKPTIICKVYDNGKFVGPSIVDEITEY